jgi:fibronectin-binding autotransporter adhesin
LFSLGLAATFGGTPERDEMSRQNQPRSGLGRTAAMAAIVLAAVAGLQRTVTASTYTWDASGTSPVSPTDGSGNWDLSSVRWSNGSSDSVWPNTGAIAVFGNNHGPAGVVTVTTPVATGGLIFNPASSGNYNISGSAAINLGPALSTALVAVNGNASPVISAPLTGINCTVEFLGTGTVTLNGSNSFTGTVDFGSGTVNASSASALSAGATGSYDLNIGSDAALNIVSNVTVTGHGQQNVDVNDGKLTIAAGDSYTLAGTGDGTYLIAQAGGTLTNNGTLTAPAAFNYTGGSLVNNGTINCYNFYDTAGPVGGNVVVGSGGINTAYAGHFSLTGQGNDTTPIGSPNGQIASGAVVNFVTSGNYNVLQLTAANNSGTLTFATAPQTALTLNLPSGFINTGTITLTANGTPLGPAGVNGGFNNATGGTFAFNTSAQVFGSVLNTGTLSIAAGGRLTIPSGTFNQAGGTLSGSLYIVNGTFLFSGGTVNLAASASAPDTLAIGGLVWPASTAATSLAILTSNAVPSSEGKIDVLGGAAANFSLLNPAGTLNISANITDGGLLKSGPGTLLLTGNSTYTGATNVSAGTLVLAAGASLATPSITLQPGTSFNVSGSAAAAAVVVDAGAVLRFPAANGSSPAIVHVQSLNLAAGSTTALGTAAAETGRTLLVINNLVLAGQTNAWTSGLDLGGNDMDVTSGSIATLTNRVRGGYNLAAGGGWNGTTAGIASSAAAADSRHLTAVGVIQNNQSGSPLFTSASPFDGYAPAAGDILLKNTYYGDANLNGKVDGSDYSLIDAGYASHGSLTGWYYGDFNYDGVVDGSDYTLIDNAFNNQSVNLNTDATAATSNAQVAPAAVPEPAMVLLVAPLFLVGRRRFGVR